MVHDVYSCNGFARTVGYAKNLRSFQYCKGQEIEVSLRSSQEILGTDKACIIAWKFSPVDFMSVKRAVKVIIQMSQVPTYGRGFT